MKNKIYQVDAFTDRIFSGNPAAVCPLEKWLPDELMQSIAAENNLAETAFYVKKNGVYELRWFTPAVEVELCGHATLAAAFVLFYYEGHQGDEINFLSMRRGNLSVSRSGDLLTLNFPTDQLQKLETDNYHHYFNHPPKEAFKGRSDLLFIFESQNQIETIELNISEMKETARGFIVSAPGESVDFVSRFFAPNVGIAEDPVTGSAHTTLTPYWSRRLGKNVLTAIQLSPRRGYLQCKDLGDRIEISGQAKLYLIGEIYFS